MHRMAPITREQTGMVRHYLHMRRYAPDEENGYDARDLCVIYRTKGRMLAKRLPGIGQAEKWLRRRTDEDEGPYA